MDKEEKDKCAGAHLVIGRLLFRFFRTNENLTIAVACLIGQDIWHVRLFAQLHVELFGLLRTHKDKRNIPVGKDCVRNS